MGKTIRSTALGPGFIAIVVFVLALAMEKSLPYRIGPDSYARFLWASRLVWVSLVISLMAIVVGLASRQRFPAFTGALCLLIGMISFGGAHSGPNLVSWCYFNLRSVARAKEDYAHKNNLTNGTIVVSQDISPFIEGSFASLKCYEHGQYIIGPLGTEPRCSVHGSPEDIDRKH